MYVHTWEGVVAATRTGPGRPWTDFQTPPGAPQADDARLWLAAIIESSNDAIVSKDLNGIVTSWNKAAERLFGYTAAEMVGQPITTIFPPDRVDEEAAILARVGYGERVDRYETVRRHKDGRAISISVTVSPIRDTSGIIIGASKIIRDLTEREVQEGRIRELQAELAHVQRLTELGQVVSTLVHEVNQPLTAIGNYVNACRRLLAIGDLERVQGALHRVADQSDRARQIVQRIRDFAKKGDIQMQAENLPQVIEEIIVLTHASVRGEGLTITKRFDPAASLAEIDRVQIHQVIFNLLRNAIEAMEEQPRRELAIETKLAEGDMLEVSVTDVGPGLSDEIRTKLFQPFVTTKPSGMGVGLSVCRAIVEMHRGRLWAEDNPGGGTIFRFTVRRAGTSEGLPSGQSRMTTRS
jgi:two-component system, LuxR family, sensor kinase FixL